MVIMIVAYTILGDSRVLSKENRRIRRNLIVEKGFKAIIAKLKQKAKKIPDP